MRKRESPSAVHYFSHEGMNVFLSYVNSKIHAIPARSFYFLWLNFSLDGTCTHSFYIWVLIKRIWQSHLVFRFCKYLSFCKVHCGRTNPSAVALFKALFTSNSSCVNPYSSFAGKVFKSQTDSDLCEHGPSQIYCIFAIALFLFPVQETSPQKF